VSAAASILLPQPSMMAAHSGNPAQHSFRNDGQALRLLARSHPSQVSLEPDFALTYPSIEA
jgi:hypothetical protein